MAKRDYYEILSVTRTVSDGELKTSYRKLAMQWHPDKNPGDAEPNRSSRKSTKPTRCLKDPQKRAAYDRFGHAAFEKGGPSGRRPGLRRICRFGFLRHLRRHLRRHDGRAARRPFGGPRARRGPALQSGDLARRSVQRQDRADRACRPIVACETCSGTGAKAGTQPVHLQDLSAARAAFARARLLHARAHLPDLSGPRPDDRPTRANPATAWAAS
jgi:molecular chaperone DnaJ